MQCVGYEIESVISEMPGWSSQATQPELNDAADRLFRTGVGDCILHLRLSGGFTAHEFVTRPMFRCKFDVQVVHLFISAILVLSSAAAGVVEQGSL